MRSRVLPLAIAAVALAFIIVGLLYIRSQKEATESVAPVESTQTATPAATPTDAASPAADTAVTQPTDNKEQTVTAPDLTTDANGLSKATVVMNTTKGVIKFKFYPKDAPNTVNRIAQLINEKFYNGLVFHRVVPGFVIQGGDPQGQGYGGSGTKLKAEFNNRRHIEGTVAMARSQDPDSADSQFYVSLGTHPHLDRNYTVFGQVVEGMDVAKKITVGDKMTTVVIE